MKIMEFTTIVGRNIIWFILYEKYGHIKKLRIEFPYDSPITLGINPQKESKKDIFIEFQK